MSVPIVHHPAFVSPLLSGHRFPMQKFGRLMDLLTTEGLARPDAVHRPEAAPRDWLARVHTPRYIDAVLTQTMSAADRRRIGLPLSPELAKRSRTSVGATVLTARLALEHGIACSTAGGSHHAFADHGSGFCIFNDVAVAARCMLAEGLAARVAIVDLDVHQGDGTASIFASDPQVFTFSMHCRTNFPLRKQQSNLDIALEADTGDSAYLARLADGIVEAVAGFRPDLVFYNAGVDTHAEDRLGRLAMSDRGLARRERLVLETCHRAGVPVAIVIGGGYTPDLEKLAQRHAIVHRIASDVARRGANRASSNTRLDNPQPPAKGAVRPYSPST